MNNLLTSQVRGRIACSNRKRSFILPFTYIYDGDYLYGEVHDKKKLDVLRKNPVVCFEVDTMQGLNNWQEVIIEGKIEELKGEEETKARDFISEHVYILSYDVSFAKKENKRSRGKIKNRSARPILCRIKIEKKSGCFEKD